jgi:hypothetical protein
MRIFKNKSFARFARRNDIADLELCGAVHDADRGLIAAELGGGVIKQRLARKGAGKSGGFRVLILFKVKDLAIFVHGFAKSEAENIEPDELVALKEISCRNVVLWTKGTRASAGFGNSDGGGMRWQERSSIVAS